MNANITDPARGGDILQWAQGVTETCRRFGGVGSANLLMREGSGGIGYEPLPENRRERRAADALHPWKVFAFAQNEDRDHCFEIHVPEGSLHVGEDAPEVGDLTPVEGQSGRYTLDCEGEIAGEAVIYLAVVREKEDEADGGASPDGEDERPEWQARVVSTPEAVEDAEEVLALLPIARLTIDDSGEYAVGRVEAQYAHSAVAFAPGGANPDKVSIDTVTADGAEDPSAIQFKDFDNEESDGGQGLAERLEVEKEGSGESAGYKVVAKPNGSKVHLVARVNGKLKYIPLSGRDEKDPDEENPPGEDDPCDHPGDKGKKGGVSPNDKEPGSGTPEGGGVSPKDGGVHPGDDGCNCD